MKRALICGISGQDGAYLAKLLLEKGYQVWGTSRDARLGNFLNLEKLNISNNVKVFSMAQVVSSSVIDMLSKSQPDEIYFLSGQSSVGLSFEQPADSIESIVYGALNLLEAVRFLGLSSKIYNASSSECFGNIPEGKAASELTSFHPRSPYGVAKASAHWLFANYREAYGLYCCNGILFNHESPLRSERFVTHKIVSTACRIANGSKERLGLGRLDIARDWGWSPDFVSAMWLMLQQPEPQDYVIATGKANTLEAFVSGVFAHLGMDWEHHVDIDPSLFRPTDISYSVGDPTKAMHNLGWKAQIDFQELVKRLVNEELANTNMKS